MCLQIEAEDIGARTQNIWLGILLPHPPPPPLTAILHYPVIRPGGGAGGEGGEFLAYTPSKSISRQSYLGSVVGS